MIDGNWQGEVCFCAMGKLAARTTEGVLYPLGRFDPDQVGTLLAEAYGEVALLGREEDLDEFNAHLGVVVLAALTHWHMSNTNVCEVMEGAISVMSEMTEVTVESLTQATE